MTSHDVTQIHITNKLGHNTRYDKKAWKTTISVFNMLKNIN